MGLAFSISNFFVTKISLANKWMRKKISSFCNLALISRENAEGNSTLCGYIDIVELFFYRAKNMSKMCMCTFWLLKARAIYLFREWPDRIPPSRCLSRKFSYVYVGNKLMTLKNFWSQFSHSGAENDSLPPETLSACIHLN